MQDEIVWQMAALVASLRRGDVAAASKAYTDDGRLPTSSTEASLEAR
jgi:hypothetical protein